ncbi:MAG: radical SAM protein [Phycisphaerae bacterium]|nr:radical SAM protein [Phycisphaerae bacterium]
MSSMVTPREHAGLCATDTGLLRAVAAGEARLTGEQGLALMAALPLGELGRWADARCRAVHGDRLRTYVIDRNINYTNVCTARCTFCAFRRDAGDEDAYTLDTGVIHEKVAELVAIGGTQILMQGGMNPALPIAWYERLLSGIKSRFPGVHIHAFSPPEFIEFVSFFDPPGSTLEEKIRWVMVRLKDAGLDSVPGGGGEIFADPVRRKIGLGKCDAQAWLTTMYVAHTLGMFTSATMMFGHIEGFADRVHHMLQVRRWQDRVRREAEEGRGPRGHYVSFISWPFQRENTPLGRVPDWGFDEGELELEFPGDAVARAWASVRGGDANGSGGQGLPRGSRAADVFDYDAMDRAGFPSASLFGKRVRMSGAADYLRTQALSRLMLDNVYSIGASWVTMGPHIGQVAMAFGANDMGSVMMEENVVSSAGTTFCLDEALLCRLIRTSGFTPAQRNNTYDLVRVHAGSDRDPDLAVTDWSVHRAKRTHQQVLRAPALSGVKITVNAR